MNKFQQRHYVAIAEVISDAKRRANTMHNPAVDIGRNIIAIGQIELLENDLSRTFGYDSEKFNAERFLAACTAGE